MLLSEKKLHVKLQGKFLLTFRNIEGFWKLILELSQLMAVLT